MNESNTRYVWENVPKEELSTGIARRMISTDQMTIAHVHFDKGTRVPMHAHEAEQLSYIIEGTLRFRFGEDASEVVDVSAGEVLHVPSNVPHSVEALETTLDMDIFSPPRWDWLDGSDAYLRQDK